MTGFQEWREQLRYTFLPTLWWNAITTQDRATLLKAFYYADFSVDDASDMLERISYTTLMWVNQCCGEAKREAGMEAHPN